VVTQCTVATAPPFDWDIPTESFELADGDFVGVGMTNDHKVLLSLDDVDRTMATRGGEPGMPTILLTPAEARWVAGELLRRATAAEQQS
jgi:hypothetical protein